MTVLTVTAKELNKLIDQRKAEKDAVFENIFQTCLQRIVKTARNQRYRCVYEVPDFVLGFPIYKLNDAILYVIKRLESDCHMMTKYMFPRTIYISWDFDEIKGKTIIAPLLTGSKNPVFVPITKSDTSSRHSPYDRPPALTTDPFLPPSYLGGDDDPMVDDIISPPQHPATERYASSLFPPMPVSTTRSKPSVSRQLLVYPSSSQQQISQQEQGEDVEKEMRLVAFSPPQHPAVGKPSTQRVAKKRRKPNAAFRAISDFKPSGKIVLNID
jgi:hypothetical protein